MQIGFIGLGQMGTGMAANLLKAGHGVAVYNRTASKTEALVRLGAQAHQSVQAVCGGEVVITMLADDAALESVVFGSGGILASLGKGAVHVSSSTISVALSERIAAAHHAAGQRYVAAPVFRPSRGSRRRQTFHRGRRRARRDRDLHAAVPSASDNEPLCCRKSPRRQTW